MPAAGGRASASRPWSVIQHLDLEGPGTIGSLAAERSLETSVCRPDRGERFPPVDEIGGLVVMGGPMGVGDTAAHPWLADERVLLAEAVAAGVPVLGVCLGAQQLAAALGARVYRASAPEVGLGAVTLTAAGRRDRVFGPEYGGLRGAEVPCVHWHGDTFDLPAEAVHLAATALCPHQAFRVGPVAYGLQFHVEVDAELAERWRPELPGGVRLPATEVAAVETAGRRLLTRFFDLTEDHRRQR